MREVRTCLACIVGLHRSGSGGYRNPARSSGLGHDAVDMPDPFLAIVGVIALACVILFPIRMWRQKTRRYGNENDGEGDVPLAPPPRRDSD